MCKWTTWSRRPIWVLLFRKLSVSWSWIGRRIKLWDVCRGVFRTSIRSSSRASIVRVSISRVSIYAIMNFLLEKVTNSSILEVLSSTPDWTIQTCWLILLQTGDLLLWLRVFRRTRRVRRGCTRSRQQSHRQRSRRGVTELIEWWLLVIISLYGNIYGW